MNLNLFIEILEMGNAASSNDQINNPQVLLSNYIDSFGYDSVSKSQYIYSSEEGLNSYQGVNYLLNNSCNLKILKMNFVSRVTQHFESINNDIFHLLTVIDSLISINTEKILNLNSSNRKVSENMSKLVLDSQGEFSKACDGIKISNECLDIIKDVIKG